MSKETKNKTATETVAENITTVAEAVASNGATAEEIAHAAATVATAPVQKPTKGKKSAKAQPQKIEGGGALHTVGKAACKRHGLASVWVTEDGQCFPHESDARAHGKNLGNSEPLKVEA